MPTIFLFITFLAILLFIWCVIDVITIINKSGPWVGIDSDGSKVMGEELIYNILSIVISACWLLAYFLT